LRRGTKKLVVGQEIYMVNDVYLTKDIYKGNMESNGIPGTFEDGP